MSFFKTLFGGRNNALGGARRARHVPSRKHRARVAVEQLETRLCPAVTDMTALAQLAPDPDGPAVLWLNFDGWTNFDAAGNDVSPFTPASGSRDQAIHEILFKTAEFFAPFNVQVVRLFGDGFHDRSSSGNTTMFIGNNSNTNGGGAGAYTPWANSDFPGSTLGVTHLPNSNPYDVAFADPVAATGFTVWSNAKIARAVAHEAGHTFGLGHVRTVGTDPTPLTAFDGAGTTPEMMSYDSTNRAFRNVTFNLTAFNGNPPALTPGMVPTYRGAGDPAAGVPLRTQNSYTYLTEILGPRPLLIDGRMDWHANVADRGAVDPGFRAGWEEGFLLSVTPPTGTVAFSRAGAIERAGDYDVFTLAGGGWYEVEVNAFGSRRPNPVVMVFDGTGRNLVAYNNDASPETRDSKVGLRTEAGRSYLIVVGAAHNWSVGDYTLVVRHAEPFAGFIEQSFVPLPGPGGAAGAFSAAPSAGAAAWAYAQPPDKENPVPDALPREAILKKAAPLPIPHTSNPSDPLDLRSGLALGIGLDLDDSLLDEVAYSLASLPKQI